MTVFASQDEIINAVSVNNRGQRLFFQKRAAAASVIYAPQTLWTGTGNPIAGSNPTLGMGGAVAVTKATTGAMPFNNASGGRTMHLLYGNVVSNVTNGGGELQLLDRLAHAQINNNQATASFSPVIDGTARLSTGEGGQILMEVTTALSGAANTRTFTYTNQDGTSGRVTPNITTVASAAVSRTPYNDFVWVPLQSGDIGVRSIESTTLVSGTATGAYNVVLARPLGHAIPLVTPVWAGERDYVLEVAAMPRIHDNSCLSMLYVPQAAVTQQIIGEYLIAEN